MAIFFTSDPHYWHLNVIKFCGRPYATREDMNEDLIAGWNSIVQPQDTVYVLGDFCFGGTNKKIAILERLQGYKILIKGNHDDKTRTMLRSGFDEVHYELMTSIEGLGKVRMSHYPLGPTSLIDKWLLKWKGFDLRYLERRPILRYEEILLHGHVHSTWKKNGRQINVGVDVWDYRPVSVSQIAELVADPREFVK